MENYYALIDWDGTIRRGFTIFPWCEFLVKNEIISSEIIEELKSQFDLYKIKQITHDGLAESSAHIYAKYLQRIAVDEIEKQAVLFTESDQGQLIDISLKLLSYLTNSSVNTIVISGAPLEVLSPYKILLSLSCVYGLELEHFDRKYTGKIKSNPGIGKNKKKLTESLIKRDWQIVAALGNSVSDFPLFEAADIRVVVDDPKLFIEGNRFDLNSEASEEASEAQLKTVLDVLKAKVFPAPECL